MKVAAIIQARMGSTRLPGKVLKKVLGKTLLEYQLERVRRAKTIDDIIIATTSNIKDDPIVALCEKLNVKYFRGSEEDVLSRYYLAATKFDVDVIVRITSDCPLIDYMVVDQTVEAFLSGGYDYASNTIERTFPRGMDTEVFSYNKLEEIEKLSTRKNEREHVTPYFYLHPEIYQLENVLNDKDYSNYRLTVDTEKDFELVKRIIEVLYPFKSDFSLNDIMDVMWSNPKWYLINSDVEQKKLN